MPHTFLPKAAEVMERAGLVFGILVFFSHADRPPKDEFYVLGGAEGMDLCKLSGELSEGRCR